MSGRLLVTTWFGLIVFYTAVRYSDRLAGALGSVSTVITDISSPDVPMIPWLSTGGASDSATTTKGRTQTVSQTSKTTPTGVPAGPTQGVNA